MAPRCAFPGRGLLLALLLAATGLVLAFTPPETCTTDADCLPRTSTPTDKTERLPGTWACFASRCQYVVAAGEACAAAWDCAAFQYARSVDPALRNLTATTLLPVDVARAWCAPRFCSLQATCASAWSLPVAPTSPARNPFLASSPRRELSCCAGILPDRACSVVAATVDTCDAHAHCQPNPASGDGASAPLVCVPIDYRDNIWIGVIMTILGATTLNIGLNLQKLGYRKWDALHPRYHPAQGQGARAAAAAAPSDLEVTEEKYPATPPVQRHLQLGFIVLRSRLAFWRNGPFLHPIWLAGFALFLVGNAINFVALRFAPQSLVAPLGSVSLVTNVVIAPWINKERLSRWDVVGIVLICIGSAISIVFSGYVAPEYKLCVLIALLQRPVTVAFLCIIGAGVIALWVFIKVMERRLDAQRDELDRDYGPEGVAITQAPTLVVSAVPPASSSPSRLARVWRRVRGGRTSDPRSRPLSTASTATSVTVTPASASPAVLEPVSEVSVKATSSVGEARPSMDAIVEETEPLPTRPSLSSTRSKPSTTHGGYPDTKASRYLLPLAYASLGGLMATLTTLFAKSLINLLSATVQGDNQFTQLFSWVILLVTVVTAVSQVFWINMGLRRYDALLQVPVFYCVWTVMDIIGGAIYYDEFRAFTAVQFVLFSLGVAIIFVGVGLLSKRLARVEEANLAEERQRQSTVIVS